MNSLDIEQLTRLDWELLKKKYSDKELETVIEKIKNGYPVQYAIGDVQFLEYNIKVDERALIPRFETELLVDKLVKRLKKEGFACGKIVDLCTGSGAIAIAMKGNFPEVQVIGVDISKDALALAKDNARLNKIDIEFRQGDVIKGWKNLTDIDVLISNPPYVRSDEKVSVSTKFEPSIALYPGEDDIIFYKKILENSRNMMNEKNIIAFEIGSEQANRISEYIKKIYPYATVNIEKDYNGFDRFIFIVNENE